MVQWVKLFPVRVPCHIKGLSSVLAASLSIKLPTNVTGKSDDMAQVLEPLPPMWESWKEFQVPAFSLAHPWLL